MQMFVLSVVELFLAWTGLAAASAIARPSGWRRVGMISLLIFFASIVGATLIVALVFCAGLIKGLATGAA